MSLQVLKLNVLARIGLIASHYNRKEQTSINPNILEFYVAYIHSRLSLASPSWVKRIEHASRPSSIRLLLLLRSEVKSPPDRLMHCYVLVKDIINDPISVISRVGFNINSLERLLHNCIPECYVPDTINLGAGRNCSYGEPHTKSHCNILNEKIFSAISESIITIMRWFGNYNIIIVLTSDVVDVEITAIGIDSICIEGEHGHCAYQVESFEDVKLGCRIYLNIQVVDSYIH